MAYFDLCNLLSIVLLIVKFVQSVLTSYLRSHTHHNFKTPREYKLFLHRFFKGFQDCGILFCAQNSLFKIFTKLVYSHRKYTNYLVSPTFGNECIVCNQACQWFHETMNKGHKNNNGNGDLKEAYITPDFDENYGLSRIFSSNTFDNRYLERILVFSYLRLAIAAFS